MSVDADSTLGASQREAPQPFCWRSWPLHDQRVKAVVAVVALIIVWVIVRWVTGQTHLALLALAVLTLTLWRFILPTQIEINAKGIELRCLAWHRQISWNAIARYELASSGVLLLPDVDNCPMNFFRGLFLPWGEHRKEVVAQLRYYLDHVEQ